MIWFNRIFVNFLKKCFFKKHTCDIENFEFIKYICIIYLLISTRLRNNRKVVKFWKNILQNKYIFLELA